MAANGVRAILRKTLFRIALLVNCSIATAPVWAAGPTGAHANAYLFMLRPCWCEALASRVFGEIKMPGLLPAFIAAFVLMAVAVIASLLPAARAARVDVMQALRSE